MLRAAVEADLPRLREIENAAGESFRPLGMDLVAEDEPASLAELREYAGAGRAWVTTTGGEVAGYVLADVVDGNGHVEQVSVHPDHAGAGHGRRLVRRVLEWAAARGPAVTLTTFVDVPWNGPYYERLGFRYLDDPGPELRALRRREAEHGLDAWPRAAMIRPAPPA
ncbi:MAG: GNAT family N-acetyltransferase [Pseudonocardia sp.]|nr:GNAT family N-acetyltransferase [Pseudonocardia sp.]